MNLIAVTATFLVSVLDTPYSVGYHFENGGCLLLIVFKWGAVVKWFWKVFVLKRLLLYGCSCNGLEKAGFLLL